LGEKTPEDAEMYARTSAENAWIDRSRARGADRI
jgi:hypothetical protein